MKPSVKRIWYLSRPPQWRPCLRATQSIGVSEFPWNSMSFYTTRFDQGLTLFLLLFSAIFRMVLLYPCGLEKRNLRLRDTPILECLSARGGNNLPNWKLHKWDMSKIIWCLSEDRWLCVCSLSPREQVIFNLSYLPYLAKVAVFQAFLCTKHNKLKLPFSSRQTIGCSYLNERPIWLNDADDHHHRYADHGGKGKNPAQANCPVWVCVDLVVGQWFILGQRKDKAPLWMRRENKMRLKKC